MHFFFCRSLISLNYRGAGQGVNRPRFRLTFYVATKLLHAEMRPKTRTYSRCLHAISNPWNVTLLEH